MKSALPAVLVFLLVGLGAFFYFSGSGPVSPDVIEENGPSVRIDASGNPILELSREAADSSTAKTEAEKKPIRYRLVDARTDKPIVGGRIYRVRGGEVLGTTDEEGFASVVGGRINAVVFGADGYLVEHFFDRRERARDLARALPRLGFLRILLEPDDLTARFRLKFARVDGSVATGVQFRISCLDEPKPNGRDVPTVSMGAGAIVPPELRAAWTRHVMLSTMGRPDFNPDVLHFGAQSENESFRCEGEADMRFVALGMYRVEAKSGDQFRRQSFEVTHTGEITIKLRKGGFFSGQVINRRDRQPIVGVGVVLRRDDAIVMSDLTGVDGRFRLGPLAPNAMRLQIEHPAFEALAIRGVRPGGADSVYELTPRAHHQVRGVVRSRPGLQPIRGAEVRLTSGDGTVAKVKTDDLGSFDVRSYLIEPMVEIKADGYLEYVEMLNANGEQRTFDLIPAQAEDRLRAGMTSLVAGKVLDANSNPAPNRPVQARPVNRVIQGAFGSRRILRGGRLVSSQMVMTNAKGEFVVEWVKSEAIRLLAPKGLSKPDEGHVLDVVLGKRHEVVLRDRR